MGLGVVARNGARVIAAVARRLRGFVWSLRSYSPTAAELALISSIEHSWARQAVRNKKTIVVEGVVVTPESFFDKSVLANELQRIFGYSITPILSGTAKKSVREYRFYQAMGVRRFVLYERFALHPLTLLKTFVCFVCVVRAPDPLKRLVQMRYDNVFVGDLIYDYVLRVVEGVVTVSNKTIRENYRIVWEAINYCVASSMIARKMDIGALVTSHKVYAHFGALCRFAIRQGALIVLRDLDVIRTYANPTRLNEHMLKIDKAQFEAALEDQVAVSEARKYLARRIAGEDPRIDSQYAYAKNAVESFDLHRIVGQKSTAKRVVLVMAHAFRDAPHVASGLLYLDYFEWLIETLRCLEENENSRVVLKLHPMSEIWGEQDALEAVRKEVSLDSVIVLPRTVSNAALFDAVDLIVTARGTAAVEYVAMGKPAITSASGFYEGLGITWNFENRADYESFLRGSNFLIAVSEEQRKRAVVALYLVTKGFVRSSLTSGEFVVGDRIDPVLWQKKYSEISRKLPDYDPSVDPLRLALRQALQKNADGRLA